MMYERDLVAGLNNDFYVVIDDVDDVIDDVDAIIDDVVISDDFHKCQDGLVKKLTEYDVQTSSLVYFLFIVLCFSLVFHFPFVV